MYGKHDGSGNWGLVAIEYYKCIGVCKFTRLLEDQKTNMRSFRVKPWDLRQSESVVLLEWYTYLVNIVRRRVIQELTPVIEPVNEQQDISGTNYHTGAAADVKSLGNLVAEQSHEMEILRKKLIEAEILASQQSGEISKWKRRAEVNPSEFDELLNELSTKGQELEQANVRIRDQLSMLRF
jgi:hypothetical protein